MARYVLRRLAQALGVWWAAYTATFVLLEVLPGDPVSAMAGAGLSSAPAAPEQLAALRTEYGFDRPVVLQYLDYLGHAVRGQFGNSVATGQPVTKVIAAALPNTLQLTSAALILAVLFGGGLAVAATYPRQRLLREALLSLPSLGVSLPSFWIGVMLVQLLSFRVHLFPAFGDDGPLSLALPAITLALPAGALVAQVLAKSLRSTMTAPYVLTATAKGAARPHVHLRHVLPNALLPVLTVVGLLAGQLLASSVVVETVFARNGLGRITAGAVNVRDIPVVQGVVVLSALVVVLVNLVVDLAFPLIDRRILLTGGKEFR